jgi:hypothetical protein
MKQGTNAKGFPSKPWTVASTEATGRGPCHQAINLITGERKPLRATYSEAAKDVPGQGPHAEPWGV